MLMDLKKTLLCRAVAGLVLLLGSASAICAGYLEQIGPLPLRFRAPAASLLEPAPVPPVEAATAEVTQSENSLEATATDPEKTGETTVAGKDEGNAGASSLPAQQSFLSGGIDTRYSSERLLEFFRTVPLGTNGSSITVAAPVEFIPPTPNRPPSSKATFIYNQ